MANPQDSYVQVATDGSGKKMDNAALTRDDGTVVYRERVVIASDEDPGVEAKVDGEDGRGKLSVTDRESADDIFTVLCEIRDMLKIFLEA